MFKNEHFWFFAQNLKVIDSKYFFLLATKIGKNRFPFDWYYIWNRTINQLAVIGEKLKADLTQKKFFWLFYAEAIWQCSSRRKIFFSKFLWKTLGLRFYPVSFMLKVKRSTVRILTRLTAVIKRRPAEFQYEALKLAEKTFVLEVESFSNTQFEKCYYIICREKEKKKVIFWSNRPWVFCPSRPNNRF